MCGKELSDDEALIVCDLDPVDFMEGPGILKGYEIRCEACIALLPRCPVCGRLMNLCETCAAHYCRRHTIICSDSSDMSATAAFSEGICEFCRSILAEIGASTAQSRADEPTTGGLPDD